MSLLKSTLLALLSISVLIILACQTAEKPVEKSAIAENTEAMVNLTLEERLANIKKDIHLAKEELDLKDKYDCCISPACDWCLLKEGSCDCRDNLRDGKAVCPGCGLGWHNGRGKLRGVTASQVKWEITHEHAESAHQH
ncbi:MAG: hypothetical protein ACE5HS_17695 [bacterium]